MAVKMYGYVRVSSEEQARRFGPDVQRSKIVEYCTKHGLPAPQCFEDAITGTVDAGDRPQFAAFLNDAAEAQRFGAEVHLVFFKADRLGRDYDIVRDTIRNLKELGYVLHSCDETEDRFVNTDPKEDPTGMLFHGLMGLIAEYDRLMGNRKMAAGKVAKREKGGYIGGKVCFGYRVLEDGTFSVDDEQAKAVRDTLQLTRLGQTLSETARRMAAKYPGMRKWDAAAVRSIVSRRDLYCKGIRGGKPHPELVILIQDD